MRDVRWIWRVPQRLMPMLLLTVTIWLTPAEVRAHALGFHGALGAGEELHRQLGLTWDTAVASDSLLNFRMNLGYERFELEDDWGGTEDYHGVILEETLGARLLANERLRLWVGPQLVTGLYDGDVGIGWGVALGGNLHLAGVTSIGLTLGVRRMEYEGFIGGDQKETVGALRLDLLFRLPRDVFKRPQ